MGLVIGFGGVLLVALSDPGNIAHGSQLAIGFVLALLGALRCSGGGLGMRVLTQREPDLDIPGITAAQFLAGGVPLIPLVLLAGGSTDRSRPALFPAELIVRASTGAAPTRTLRAVVWAPARPRTRDAR